MSRQTAVILGLPAACNPVKVKLIFEAECKVPIKEIKVDSKKATVELTNEQDYSTFLANFPKSIKFGNVQHALKIQSEDTSPTNPPLSHSTTESKGPVPFVHSTVQHWSSLKQLPACKSGLLAQPSDDEISPQSIREYFENNQKSCGGPIKEMIPMIDGIFITFKEENVSEKVWNFRPHRICGKSVTVYRKLVPVPFQRKIIIKDQQDGNLEIEKLRTLLHQCSRKGIFPKGVNKFSLGVFLAIYNNDVDENDIEEIVKEFKKKHSANDVTFLTKFDCIRMHSVPRDISDRELEILFENRVRTGGGIVTRIDRLCNGEILVHFSSYEDAEDVVKKFTGKTLPVFDANVKLRQHFQNWQANQMALEKQHYLDQYYHSWLQSKGVGKDENPNEATVWYGNVDADILRFFMKRSEHVLILNSRLSDLGVATVTEHGIKIVLKKAGVNHEVVKNMVKIFMTSYISMKCEVSQEMSKQLADNRPDDVYIRRADHKQEIIVTGLKTEVESFIQSLKFTSDIYYQYLKEDAIRWLVESRMLVQLQKDYSEIADCSQNAVRFSGENMKILAARSAITELLKKLKLVKFTSDIPDFIEFLKGAGSNERIATNVLEAWLKQGIYAILVIKQDWPYILTLTDCSDMAFAVLSSALTHDEMEVQSTSLEIKQMPAWKTIKSFESEGKLRIKVKKDGVLAIVGFLHHVTNAMMELQQYGFKHKHKNLIKMEQGMAQHVTHIIDDFQTLCQKRHVSHELSEEGIVVKGKKDDVDIVLDEVEKWKSRMVKKAFTVKTFGAADFFGTKEGENLLSTASANHKATVIFNSEPPPKEQTSGASAYFLRSSQVPIEETVSSIMIGPLKVSVRRGNIVEEANDAIINSVGPSFSLTEGMLSRAVLAKGGRQIQSELSQHSGDYIRLTSSGKLICKRIFHVAFPSDEQKFIACLVDVLLRADKRKVESLSMPAVGTGAGGLPCSVMARIILKSIVGFAKISPKHLRILDIVLLEPLHLQDFQKELFNFGKKEGLLPATPKPVTSQPISQLSSDSESAHVTSNVPNSIKIGKITLSVRQGDITEERNHAIVNSTGATFDLSKGMVSQAIVKKGGSSIQREVWAVKGDHSRVTAAGKLKCIKILHVVTPTYRDKIGDSIKHILRIAEREYFPSLSIPAIGTGNLRMAVADVARIVLKAIREFMSNDPNLTYLSKVDFVIFDKEQMKEFRDAIFKDAAVLGSSVDKPQMKQPELLIYSLEKDKVKEVFDWIKLKLFEALETTINHDNIRRFGTKEAEYLSSCEKRFKVHITRSEDKIVIQGLKEDAQKAAEKVNSLLQKILPSQDRYIWRYCDTLGRWHHLEAAVSEDIEKSYQKHLERPYSSGYYHTIMDSKEKSLNFTSMKIGYSLQLERLRETDVDADTALKAEMNHFGNSGGNESSSKSGGSSKGKKTK